MENNMDEALRIMDEASICQLRYKDEDGDWIEVTVTSPFMVEEIYGQYDEVEYFDVFECEYVQ